MKKNQNNTERLTSNAAINTLNRGVVKTYALFYLATIDDNFQETTQGLSGAILHRVSLTGTWNIWVYSKIYFL